MCRKLIPVLLLISTVVSCALAVDFRTLFPCAEGDKWEYSVTENGLMSFGEGPTGKSAENASAGRTVSEIVTVKERRPNGDVLFLERESENTKPILNDDPSQTISESNTLLTAKGLFSVSERSSDEHGVLKSKWQVYDTPLLMFDADMFSGNEWTVGNVVDEGIIMPLRARLLGTETVTVPAGVFKDCQKVCFYTGTVYGSFNVGGRMATVKDGRTVHTLWLYPGVGVVKEALMSQIKMGIRPEKTIITVTMTGTQSKVRELLPGYVVK